MYRLVKPTVLSDVKVSEAQAVLINLIAFGGIQRMHVHQNAYTIQLRKSAFQNAYPDHTEDADPVF